MNGIKVVLKFGKRTSISGRQIKKVTSTPVCKYELLLIRLRKHVVQIRSEQDSNLEPININSKSAGFEPGTYK